MAPRRVTLVALVAGGHGGVPRYAQALVRAVDEIASEFPELDLSVLTTERGADVLGALSLSRHTVPLRAPRLNRGPVRVVADQIAAVSADSELLHFFDLTGPVLAPRRPFVATAHDLSLLHGYGRVLQLHKRKLIPWAARHARALVAISQFTKDEVVERLGIPADKITVIHSGPGLPAAHVERSSERPGATPRPYLLFVGNLTESKNLPFAISAFDRAGVDAELMLVGRPLERFGEIQGAIAAAAHRDRIRLVTKASDAELDGLYRGALALLLPSRYEGFGLTALEAMSRGCPVLASDIPALREISGAGAELLSPDDEAAWTDALRRVVDDGAYRSALAERGRRAVAAYSWQSTARALCTLLRDVSLSRAPRRGGFRPRQAGLPG